LFVVKAFIAGIMKGKIVTKNLTVDSSSDK